MSLSRNVFDIANKQLRKFFTHTTKYLPDKVEQISDPAVVEQFEQISQYTPKIFRAGKSKLLTIGAGQLGIREIGRSQEMYFKSRRIVKTQKLLRDLVAASGIGADNVADLNRIQNRRFLDVLNERQNEGLLKEFGIQMNPRYFKALKKYGLDLNKATVRDVHKQYMAFEKFGQQAYGFSKYSIASMYKNMTFKRGLKYQAGFGGAIGGYSILRGLMGQAVHPTTSVHQLVLSQRNNLIMGMYLDNTLFRR